jgi:hypothetical protein
MTSNPKTTADPGENGVRPERRSFWQGVAMGLSAPAFLFTPRRRTQPAPSVLKHQSAREALRSDVRTVGSDMWRAIGRFHGESDGSVGSIRRQRRDERR